MGMKIYFIQMGDTGPIKIGQSVNPMLRIEQLQTANPETLRILWVYEGDQYTESQVHELFKGNRIRGEWFAPTDDLISFIESELQNDYEINVPSNNNEISVNHGLGYGYIFNIEDLSIEVGRGTIRVENFEGQTIHITSNGEDKPSIQILGHKK